MREEFGLILESLRSSWYQIAGAAPRVLCRGLSLGWMR